MVNVRLEHRQPHRMKHLFPHASTTARFSVDELDAANVVVPASSEALQGLDR